MAQTESKPLSPEEKRSLAESARLCEMIVEANPSDTGALETLKEIYTKLGDRENLARVVARLAGTVGGRPSASVTPTPEVATAPAPPPAPAPVVELEPVMPSGDNGRGAGKRAAVIASERRGGSLSRLGDRLVAEKLISTEQLQRALAEQKGSADKLGTILVRLGFITEDSLVSFLSKQYSIPAITVAQVDPDPDVLKLVPEQIAKKHSVLPIKRMGNVLTLAMADPTNVFALDDVGFMTGLQIQPVVASEAAIRKAFERLYETGASVTDMMSELEEADTDVEVVEGGEETFTKADVFDLKERHRRRGRRGRRGDLHQGRRLRPQGVGRRSAGGPADQHDPHRRDPSRRLRHPPGALREGVPGPVPHRRRAPRDHDPIDGVLHEIMTPPKRLEAALTSRVKIMATLDIAERRLPQDGRIKLRYHQREIDFRVSTLPTIFGEKTVMRILDKDALQLDLTALGFDPWSMEQFTKAIHSPYGMILITGPTGSGKTTTLYSAIHTINSPDINIMTAEDPVEYNLKGVNQVQVNDEIGRTFAACLRSFLRQDPDVILVGETRDLETAQIGIRAALTGHLVLSTLHTNDCPSTPARLLDMGIPPFLVSSSLQLILAQRLGRRVCRDCKEPYEASEESLVPYGHVPQGLGTVNFYKGKGCQTCNFTGMKGRVAIYEVMPVTTEIRDLILRNATTNEIQDAACSQGMKTLRQNALQKVIDGVTTVEEVLRVTLGT